MGARNSNVGVGMKIEVNDHGKFVLSEVYDTLFIKTRTGEEVALNTEGDTVTITVPGSDRWYRVVAETGEMEEI